MNLGRSQYCAGHEWFGEGDVSWADQAAVLIAADLDQMTTTTYLRPMQYAAPT